MPVCIGTIQFQLTILGAFFTWQYITSDYFFVIGIDKQCGTFSLEEILFFGKSYLQPLPLSFPLCGTHLFNANESHSHQVASWGNSTPFEHPACPVSTPYSRLNTLLSKICLKLLWSKCVACPHSNMNLPCAKFKRDQVFSLFLHEEFDGRPCIIKLYMNDQLILPLLGEIFLLLLVLNTIIWHFVFFRKKITSYFQIEQQQHIWIGMFQMQISCGMFWNIGLC